MEQSLETGEERMLGGGGGQTGTLPTRPYTCQEMDPVVQDAVMHYLYVCCLCVCL